MKRPVVLLDRDGTIIVERDYLSDPEQVTLEEGAADGLRALADAGALLIVVSNQSGVGRGYFDIAAVEAVNMRVNELLAQQGIAIAGWYFCPHAPDEDCDCRKPAPGMVARASADLEFDPAMAYVVGDKHSDLELAWATGGTAVLVRTGHGRGVVADPDRTLMAKDLREASALILSHFEQCQE